MNKIFNKGLFQKKKKKIIISFFFPKNCTNKDNLVVFSSTMSIALLSLTTWLNSYSQHVLYVALSLSLSLSLSPFFSYLSSFQSLSHFITLISAISILTLSLISLFGLLILLVKGIVKLYVLKCFFFFF